MEVWNVDNLAWDKNDSLVFFWDGILDLKNSKFPGITFPHSSRCFSKISCFAHHSRKQSSFRWAVKNPISFKQKVNDFFTLNFHLIFRFSEYSKYSRAPQNPENRDLQHFFNLINNITIELDWWVWMSLRARIWRC
jgi:hypothetical protein